MGHHASLKCGARRRGFIPTTALAVLALAGATLVPVHARAAAAKPATVTIRRANPLSDKLAFAGEVAVSGLRSGGRVSFAVEADPASGLPAPAAGSSSLEPASVEIPAGSGGTTFPVVLKFSGDGAARLAVRVHGVTGLVLYTHSRSFRIDGGLVSDGLDAPEAVSIAARVRAFGADGLNRALTGADAEAHRAPLEALTRPPAPASATPSAPGSSAAPPAPGSTVTFRASWKGVTQAGGEVTLPIEGAYFEVVDTVTNLVTETSYLGSGVSSPGVGTFRAPANPFLVRLSAKDRGVGGVNAIEVRANADRLDTNPAVITQTAGRTADVVSNVLDFTSTGSVGAASDRANSAWSVFHACRDILASAKTNIGVSRPAPLKVFFGCYAAPPSPVETSSFVGTDVFGYGAYIVSADRRDWDVIAHELAHDIALTRNALLAVGGAHDGSNQYGFAGNAATFQNKQLSNRLAFSQGFATWLGVSLLEFSPYKGKLANVGDVLYSDTEDAAIDSPLETPSLYRGEDSEWAVASTLWKMADGGSAPYARGNAGLVDTVSIQITGVWSLVDGKSIDGLADLYGRSFLPGGAGPLADRNVVYANSTFCETGCAPILVSPVDSYRFPLFDSPDAPLSFRWLRHASTGDAAVQQSTYRLVIYSDDYSRVLLSKDLTDSGDQVTYALTAGDKAALLAAAGSDRKDLRVIVYGLDEGTRAESGRVSTGYYGSAPRRLATGGRFSVVVVDDSGSNGSTDPDDLRVAAAKATVNRLVSRRLAASLEIPADLAAAIKFTNTVTPLSDFDDPEIVEGRLTGFQSNGGTNIDGGINDASARLSALATATTAVAERSSIFVFTDGDNNNGPAPVVAAIDAARAKGFRVHYGFLSPVPDPLRPPPAAGKSLRGEPVPASGPSKRSLEAFDTSIVNAVLATGGTYGVIQNAESQRAFVDQAYARGFTPVDSPVEQGGQDFVSGVATAQKLSRPHEIRTLSYTAAANTITTLTVTPDYLSGVSGAKAFRPLVWAVGGDGRVIATGSVIDQANSVVGLSIPGGYSGRYTVKVAADSPGTGTGLFAIQLAAADPQAISNISTRGFVGSGDSVMIAGVIIKGSQAMKVGFRGLGPTLGDFSVPTPLANPVLKLYRQTRPVPTLIATNDDWGTLPLNDQVALAAADLVPAYANESALVATLDPGEYTAILSGVGNGVGNGLVSADVIGGSAETRLNNISTRLSLNATPGSEMIAGFIITGIKSKKVVVRCQGSALLAPFGVPDTLDNPIMQVFRQGTPAQLLVQNDDWNTISAADRATLTAANLVPAGSLDSAAVLTLPPGAYTAIVRGYQGTVGNCLLSVDELN